MELSPEIFETSAIAIPGAMLLVLVILMKFVEDTLVSQSIQILFLEQDCKYFLYPSFSFMCFYLVPRPLLMGSGQTGVTGAPVTQTV